jgi:AcrR family transcriptional regulator
MEEKELEVIEQSMQLFMKSGVKSVTMDDVARGLGMSKKTLYNYVKDKNDLVDKVLTYSCDADNTAIAAICEKDLNAIDESYEISNFIFKHIDTIHPSIIYDLQKYHLQAWEKFTNLKKQRITECYTRNITKGIEEGLYRDDLIIPIIVHLYTSRFEIIFNPDIFPREKFNPAHAYLEMFRYHIRGIASEKGIKYLAKKIRQEKTLLHEN